MSSANQVLNYLVSIPKLANTVVKRKLARELLEQTDGKVMAQGQLWELVVKPAGAGMYRVSLKERP